MGSDPEHAMRFANPAGWHLVSVVIMATSGVWAGLFRRWPNAADRVGAGLLVAGSIVGLIAASAACISTHAPSIERAWALPWGRFFIAIDGLSAAFLFPVLVVPALAAVYGVGSWSQHAHPRNAAPTRIFLGVLAAAMSLLVVARDAVLFLMAFEVMTLAVFFLVTTEDEKREVRDAGWVYLAASHFSFILLLGLFTSLRVVSGTFDLNAGATETAGAWTRSALFLATLVAFGVKAGVMPLHVWLPAAHANAPSHVSAVLSGVVIKTGVYAIMRVLTMLSDPPLVWGVLLLILGATSSVAGVAFAIGQHDLKRLLAYHSIENIGIIVMGLGLAVVGQWADEPLLVILGFSAAVLHVWNHAIFKSLLFLSAGVVVHAAGTREIDRLGGLARNLPWSAAFFTLGAVAICGLPPLNGFMSEFILYIGALRGLQAEGAWMATFIAPVLAMVGTLAGACFVKVVGTVFLGLPRANGVTAGHECGWSMRAPMLVLAALCVALGVAPALAVRALDAAAGAWIGVWTSALPAIDTVVPFESIAIPVVAVAIAAGTLCMLLMSAARGTRTVGTWDCGYLEPAPRMQYTGSSLGNGLVRIFQFILHTRAEEPVIREAIPARAAYRTHVDDVVLERWVMPVVRWCADRCSRIRHRQSARIQTYITYVVVATLGLLLLGLPLIHLLQRIVTK